MKPSRWIALGLLAALAAGIAQRPLGAQNELVPREVAELFRDIDDIDKMRVLNPVNLTTEQLDKLITTIKASQEEFNRKLVAAAVSPIREISKEIKEARRKLLAGGSIPKDFDEKVKKLQSDFVARRSKEEYNTLKSLSDAIRKILTPEQVTKAISLARSLTEKEGKPTLKGSDDQFFNGYVLGTFVVYPRIVPLLEDMKKARSGDGSGEPGGEPRQEEQR